jgi:hypothetical protein
LTPTQLVINCCMPHRLFFYIHTDRIDNISCYPMHLSVEGSICHSCMIRV